MNQNTTSIRSTQLIVPVGTRFHIRSTRGDHPQRFTVLRVSGYNVILLIDGWDIPTTVEIKDANLNFITGFWNPLNAELGYEQ